MVLSVDKYDDVFSQYMKLYKETDEKCQKHNISLMQVPGRKPFCPQCAIINTAHAEALMINEETNKAFENERAARERNSNKGYLKNRSIVTNKELFDMTFENFDAMDEETAVNKEKALEVARDYYKGFDGNNILTGKFGTGKTHLAMAILNQLNEHTDKKLLFVQTDELLRRIKTSFNDENSIYTEEFMVNLLTKVDLLVLDDVGAEVGSVDRNKEASDFNIRVMNSILNGRTDKPTIFTTNLGTKELRQVYDGRLLSRMLRGIEEEDVISFKKTTDKRTTIEF